MAAAKAASAAKKDTAKAGATAPAENDVIKEEKAAPKEDKPVVPKNVDPESYVVVRNGYHGRLFYRSSRTGERFLWTAFGDEQEMTLRELKNAKNSSKKFFVNNWFMFQDAWVIDYLGVRQYYKKAVRIEDYDKIFTKSPDELKELIGGMTPSQRRSAAYRATELIREGEIDSLKVITALEEAFGVELIEK